MKKYLLILIVVVLSGCTAALKRGQWDSWIGHDWHEMSANYSNCYGATKTQVSCAQGLGTLTWYFDEKGIINSWYYSGAQ